MLVVGKPDDREGDLRELIQAPSTQVISVSALRRSVQPWLDAAALIRLSRIVWVQRPQIIHTHMAKAGTLGRIAGILYNTFGPGRAGGSRVQLIHTYHGHVLERYFSSWISRIFVRIEQGLARSTTCLVAVSQGVQDELVKLGIGRPQQWRVIPLGLDLSALEQLPLPNGDGPIRVGLVGRLVPIKNPRLFLEALGQVSQSTAVVGMIVGDGPLRESLEEEAKRLGIESIVQFTGWQRNLRNIYEALDVTCVTSWNEGTPVALIEAMAAGRAVIATDVGGVRDLLDEAGQAAKEITEGSFCITMHGILVRPGDSAGLSAALRRLANDRELRLQLGRAARVHVIARFRSERLCSDMAALYRELLGEGVPVS